LYEGLARNYLLQGRLNEAARTLEKYVEVAKRETSVTRARFYLAYLEFLRGDMNGAIQEIRPVIDFYDNEPYSNLIDDLSNQPLWLLALIATQRRDFATLSDVLKKFERKVIEHKVNATNYFRIYKFYIHLKILEAHLMENEIEIVKYIAEGKRIQKKMGYWFSMFDMAFFFDKYAEILLGLNRADEALELLNSVIAYNPNYVTSRLKLAQIYLNKNDPEEARRHYQKAVEFLSRSDENYVLVDMARRLGKKLP
jgi:tetratricopeptide (TPR) repeat protein